MGSVAPTADPYAEFKKGSIEGRLFINGDFVDAKSGKTFEIVNPATEKVSAVVQDAGVEDVDDAVAAAKAAFPAWSELGAAARGDYLFKLADALEKRMAEMNYLDAISMGAVAANNFANPVAVSALRYHAGKAYDNHGDSSLNTPGFVNITLRQPYGVTAGITPWNVPVAMVLLKLAPALISGNTIIIKSSEKAPLSPLVVAKACQDIDLPKGVFNLVNGFGRPTGEALAKHMDVRKISFTGSALAGRAIQKAAAESNLKNVTLELGGKSPLVIFDDADLEKAVPAAATSILLNSGQVCYASSRIYVHADIADKFTEAMKGAMSQMGASGDPLTSQAMRGPQVDKLQFDRVMDFLNHAKENNLDVPLGGGREPGETGFYISPTIISGPPESSRVMREEIFGPVVCINTFTDEDEVMERANDTEYGLYASVYTKDLSRALRIAKKFEAGSVGVNCTSPTMALDMPFGGWKGSGDGRELSRYATDHWTELKSVFIQL